MLCNSRSRPFPQPLNNPYFLHRLSPPCIFNLDDARECAAKTGLLASLLLAKNTEPILTHYSNVPDFKNLQALSIEGDWQKLNKLKNTKPNAFYYWWQARRIGTSK